MTTVWTNWSLVDMDKPFDNQILPLWSLAKALLASANPMSNLCVQHAVRGEHAS